MLYYDTLDIGMLDITASPILLHPLLNVPLTLNKLLRFDNTYCALSWLLSMIDIAI
jgi:hypothetical protein